MPNAEPDGFDNLNNGNLNGQNGWSGSTLLQVQGSVVQAGAKAVGANSNSTGEIYKNFTKVAVGSFTVYLRVSNSNGNGANCRPYFFLNEGSDYRIYTQLYGQTMRYTVSGSWVTLATGLAYDTWHKLDIEWRAADLKVRYRCNDGVWTDWVNPHAAISTGLDRVVLGHYPASGAASINYWDYDTYVAQPNNMLIMF